MEIPNNLSKLSLSILENFVENTLGKTFIDELRAPTDRALAIATALENTEKRFVNEYPDTEVSSGFLSLPLYNQPKIIQAAQKFFSRPTSQEFPTNLREYMMSEYGKLSRERIDQAVNAYIALLTEELALADEKFRENIRALAEIRGLGSQGDIKNQSVAEMAETLKNVQNLLSQLQIPLQTNKSTIPKSYIFGELPDLVIDPELCFVLMPFGPAWSRKLYDNHIVKACKNRKLNALRADDIYGARGIMHDVWTYINQARLIIADLTTRNPNVFYEVGIAHTLGKEVVLVTQTMDDVPFDLRAIRCIVYSLELDGPQKLEKDLVRTISSILG